MKWPSRGGFCLDDFLVICFASYIIHIWGKACPDWECLYCMVKALIIADDHTPWQGWEK